MSDIRKDLEQRLVQVAAERARLDKLETMYRELIAEEEKLAGASGVLPSPKESAKLGELLLGVLSDRKPRTIDELKGIGASWPAIQESKFPGRSINVALVGLQKGGLVFKNSDGSWQISGHGRKKKGALV